MTTPDDRPVMSPDDVLDYWFGDGDPNAAESMRFSLWFGAGDQLDEDIRRRFLPVIELAGLGRLDGWKATARGRLAWTILLDQFTRNAFRGTARMFVFDLIALASTREAIAAGQDRELPPIQRAFLYLPLEHSEEAAAQRESVAAFRALLDDDAPAIRGTLESMLDYAVRHARVIERFGRYPHRNELLCRRSTEEELAFLASPEAPF